MTFQTITGHEDYEILNVYPFTIRRIDNKYEPKININTGGYPYIFMNRKPFLIHRLVALQFLENDNPKENTIVDHINGIITDYHIENLRWTTLSRNQHNLHNSRNGIEYEFVDELEANSYEIEYASKWEFKNYYVSGDKVLFFDGDRYRVLLKQMMGKQWRVWMTDIDGVGRYISKRILQAALYDQYGLMFFEEI